MAAPAPLSSAPIAASSLPPLRLGGSSSGGSGLPPVVGVRGQPAQPHSQRSSQRELLPVPRTPHDFARELFEEQKKLGGGAKISAEALEAVQARRSDAGARSVAAGSAPPGQTSPAQGDERCVRAWGRLVFELCNEAADRAAACSGAVPATFPAVVLPGLPSEDGQPSPLVAHRQRRAREKALAGLSLAVGAPAASSDGLPLGEAEEHELQQRGAEETQRQFEAGLVQQMRKLNAEIADNILHSLLLEVVPESS